MAVEPLSLTEARSSDPELATPRSKPSKIKTVLLATDLGVRASANALGIDLAGGRPDWAPWRTYATFHLWSAH